MSEFINDKNLSLKAKGALSMLLSLKNLNKKRIIELSKDGKDSVNSAIIELQENGYLQIYETREKGRRVYNYYAYSFPKFLL